MNLKQLSILILCTCTSCTNEITVDRVQPCNVVLDFTTETSTRASTNPSDYFNKLNLQLFDDSDNKVFSSVRTQKKEDADFGHFTMQIAPGTYTVVAVGHSSAKSATIKSVQQVQFTASDGSKLTDTFCHCSVIEVAEDGRSRELRMNRVAAMLVIRTTDDEVPDSFAKLLIEYTGGSANFNPTTSQGTTKSSQSELRDAAKEYQCFTFPYMSNTCQLQVTLTALTLDGTIINKRTITDVPMTRNYITTYTGPLFDAGDGEIVQTDFGLTVNGEWDGSEHYSF